MFSGWWNLFRLGSYPLCGTFGVRISKRGSAVLLHKIRRVSYVIDERFQLSLSRFFFNKHRRNNYSNCESFSCTFLAGVKCNIDLGSNRF